MLLSQSRKNWRRASGFSLHNDMEGQIYPYNGYQREDRFEHFTFIVEKSQLTYGAFVQPPPISLIMK